MKKIMILVIAICIFCMTSCTNKKNIEENQEVIEEPQIEEEVYTDNNPVKVAFYDDNNNIIINYQCKWTQYKDMLWINIFPTNDESIAYTNLKDTWNRYKSTYDDINYKFGINISYTLKKGEKTNLTILKPSDNASIFNYIQIYLYDGYNATTSWYDHIEDNEVTDSTVFTSIKLTASTYIDEILSPLSLTVFTYDSMDDFDENMNYIGKSKYTISIEKTN